MSVECAMAIEEMAAKFFYCEMLNPRPCDMWPMAHIYLPTNLDSPVWGVLLPTAR